MTALRGLVVALALAPNLGCVAPTEEQPRAVTQTIGPEGGQVALDDLVSLKIPEAALNEEIELTIAVVAEPPAAPQGLSSYGDVFAFLPHGTTFAQPATASFLAAPIAVTEGTQYALMRKPAPNEGTWLEVEAELRDGRVEAELTTFSLYSQMAEAQPAGCPLLGPLTECTAPTECDGVPGDCNPGFEFGFIDEIGCPGCVPIERGADACAEGAPRWTEFLGDLFTKTCIGYCETDADCWGARLTSATCVPNCVIAASAGREHELFSHLEIYAAWHCQDCGGADGFGYSTQDVQVGCLNKQCVAW